MVQLQMVQCYIGFYIQSISKQLGEKKPTSRVGFFIAAFVNQTSIFPACNAFDSIKFLRGSTSSPISVVKI